MPKADVGLEGPAPSGGCCGAASPGVCPGRRAAQSAGWSAPGAASGTNPSSHPALSSPVSSSGGTSVRARSRMRASHSGTSPGGIFSSSGEAGSEGWASPPVSPVRSERSQSDEQQEDDKHDDDKARGVGTFPVRVGEVRHHDGAEHDRDRGAGALAGMEPAVLVSRVWRLRRTPQPGTGGRRHVPANTANAVD